MLVKLLQTISYFSGIRQFSIHAKINLKINFYVLCKKKLNYHCEHTFHDKSTLLFPRLDYHLRKKCPREPKGEVYAICLIASLINRQHVEKCAHLFSCRELDEIIRWIRSIAKICLE